jgi:hypothetical protein
MYKKYIDVVGLLIKHGKALAIAGLCKYHNEIRIVNIVAPIWLTFRRFISAHPPASKHSFSSLQANTSTSLYCFQLVPSFLTPKQRKPDDSFKPVVTEKRCLILSAETGRRPSEAVA